MRYLIFLKKSIKPTENKPIYSDKHKVDVKKCVVCSTNLVVT